MLRTSGERTAPGRSHRVSGPQPEDEGSHNTLPDLHADSPGYLALDVPTFPYENLPGRAPQLQAGQKVEGPPVRTPDTDRLGSKSPSRFFRASRLRKDEESIRCCSLDFCIFAGSRYCPNGCCIWCCHYCLSPCVYSMFACCSLMSGSASRRPRILDSNSTCRSNFTGMPHDSFSLSFEPPWHAKRISGKPK